MKDSARNILYITNDFDAAYRTEMNFSFYCHPEQFLPLICRENQPNNKYAFAEMQFDRQYSLTEMENSFVGQVICRNCGFSLVFFLLSLSFSFFHCQFLSSFPPSRKLDRGTTNRTTKHGLDNAPAEKCQQIL